MEVARNDIQPAWRSFSRLVRHSVARILLGATAVAVLTATCFRLLDLGFATASPLYLLVVVLQSLTGDFFSSAVVSVLAAGCLDYFFVTPLFSFAVTGPLNVVALISFLVTSLVITKLVSRIRTEARVAKLHKDRIDRLYHLAQQLLALEPEMAVGERLLQPFAGVFGTRAVCIFDAERAELHSLGRSRSHLPERTRAAFLQEKDSDDPVNQVSVRVLRVGGKTTGAMGFEGLEEPELTAGPLISLAAASQERTRAFQRASESAAAAQTEVYRSAILDALAHEFKTPLATILAAAGGIRETGSLRAEQLEMTETVESEATRLGNLTSRLLRVARLDREDVRPQMEVTNLAGVVADIVDQYKRLPSDRRIAFTRQEESIEALADTELLRLALSQLLDNACKYSVPGSEITVAMESQGDMIFVRVANNGSSIPAGEQNRIFDRFYRGEDSRRFTTGSGLGLYVARKIALAHGGQLDLDIDGLSDGVTFYLAIPKARSESES
jgi:two-component system, OmpR family, sensor histidine kinase KdpD